MLSNHQFVIHLNNNRNSKRRTLNNGLPQGSVLATLKKKFGGKLEDIFNATPEAIEWVRSLDINL